MARWSVLLGAVCLVLACVTPVREARSQAATAPVVELRFDGNLADAVDPKRELKAQGTLAFAEGRAGKALLLDGRSWIDTGFLQSRLGNEFTLECWVLPDGRQNAYADIFGNHTSDGSGVVLQQNDANTNEFSASFGAGGRWVTTSAVPLAAANWQHVALVKTKSELQFFLNGVLVASEQDAAPAKPSTMPIGVGLGYADPARCFRGRIDDFRIWNKALADFSHAGIDPAVAKQTRGILLDAAPRAAAGPAVQSWVLETDDTRLRLGIDDQGRPAVYELAGSTAGRNWTVRPVAFPLLSEIEVAGQRKSLDLRFREAKVEDRDGRSVSLVFASSDPPLELVSQWQAHPGPGPVRHVLRAVNRGSATVTIGEQPTFDLDLAGAAAVWSIHSDGGTPDPVGIYRQPLDQPGRRHTIKTTPNGDFIPYAVFEAKEHGVYLGLEWSFCRIETVTLEGTPGSVRVRAGNRSDLRMPLQPGESCEIRPGFIGAFRGDLDDAGNRLRRWLYRHALPTVLHDPGYPKVQWNAFGATGKTPGSWDPVESKFYPLVDAIAPLGYEEVMIDVGWWEGNEPDSDREDWPSGMRKAAEHAHAKGLRFGLYWTDNLDMALPAAQRQRAARIARLFREHQADMWRSDSTRGEVIGHSFASTRGFYAMVDRLAAEIPNFQWENCCSGGRLKDFGVMRRTTKVFNSDTYSTLHVRQAFYDSSHVVHPIQIEGHLGSVDGKLRPRGVAAMRFAFRSASLGAPEWFLDSPSGGNGCEPWSSEEKDAIRACVETYKTKIRPLLHTADVYHILPRPDGKRWDGLEYFDPASGRGVVYLFKPAAEPATEKIRFRGLDPLKTYRLVFADGSNPAQTLSGKLLLDQGIVVRLDGAEASELVLFEAVEK